MRVEALCYNSFHDADDFWQLQTRRGRKMTVNDWKENSNSFAPNISHLKLLYLQCNHKRGHIFCA